MGRAAGESTGASFSAGRILTVLKDVLPWGGRAAQPFMEFLRATGFGLDVRKDGWRPVPPTIPDIFRLRIRKELNGVLARI